LLALAAIAAVAWALATPVAAFGATTAPPQDAGSVSPVQPRPLEQLTGNGTYHGLSIVGANGGRPIRRPRELQLGFHTITDHRGEENEEVTILGWELNCNGHSYRVDVTPTRLNVSEEAGTRIRCAGRVQEEERWLERFFEASPHWRLSGGHLILTARDSRILLRHRRTHAEE
jgi:hypothetical protein